MSTITTKTAAMNDQPFSDEAIENVDSILTDALLIEYAEGRSDLINVIADAWESFTGNNVREQCRKCPRIKACSDLEILTGVKRISE